MLESILVYRFAFHVNTILAATGAEDDGPGVGLWVFLGLLAVGFWFVIRRISQANLRRLERGSGPETVQDIKAKRSARKARQDAKDQKAQEQKAQDQKAGRDAAEGDQHKGKTGNKTRKKDRAKGGKGSGKHKAGADTPLEDKPPEPVADALLLPPGKALVEGLSRTRSEGFVGRLGKLFKGRQIDESLLDELEEVLFTADIGVRTSDKLLEGLRVGLKSKELSDEAKVWTFLRAEAENILRGAGSASTLERPHTAGKPYVLLVIGVNGAGKTTSIGKLAHRIVASGKKVIVGAGDTYRAGAVDQLAVWAKRVGAELIEGKDGADPSSVLFDAVKAAEKSAADVVLLDTAGRLHTNVNLVEELKKVNRVIGKAQSGAPHEVLLVLDATNGQNAIFQAHTFAEAVGVTGIILTKLDGTAKGGVILGIADELKIPIAWVGIGERTEDLRPFDPKEFVDALFPGRS